MDHATVNVILDKTVLMDRALEDVLLDLETATMMDSARLTSTQTKTIVAHVAILVILKKFASVEHVNAIKPSAIFNVMPIQSVSLFPLIAITAEHAIISVTLDKTALVEPALEDVLLDLETATMMDSARLQLLTTS